MSFDVKAWFKSQTIWSDILTVAVGFYAVLVPVLASHGINLPPLESGWLATVLTILAGLGIDGRRKATTKIG